VRDRLPRNLGWSVKGRSWRPDISVGSLTCCAYLVHRRPSLLVLSANTTLIGVPKPIQRQPIPTEHRWLVELSCRALERRGARSNIADCIAHYLVLADLSGHPSHGVRLLPRYLAGLGSPGLVVDENITVSKSVGAVVTLDAHGLIGYPVMEEALSIGSGRAETYGATCVGIRNCGHAGRAGSWAEIGAAAGYVTLVFLGGAEPPFTMVAKPGARPAMQTNPIAVGVPGSSTDLVLDMATSAIAFGKVSVLLEKGHDLPSGSAVDRLGKETIDPSDLLNGGFLLPAAGHKGFGLAAVVEALGVALVGASSTSAVLAEGALIIMIKHDALADGMTVVGAVDAIQSRIRAATNDGTILAPGDLERAARASGRLAVSDELLAEIRQLAGN